MQSVGERTGSQKILRVISIVQIIEAILLIVFGIMGVMGGAAIGVADPASVADLTAEAGMSQGDVGGMVAGVGISVIVSAFLSILIAVFGLRASNDVNKIMPAWIFSVIGLVGSCISLVMRAINGTLSGSLLSVLLSLAIAVLTFWVCNNIKVEAGK